MEINPCRHSPGLRFPLILRSDAVSDAGLMLPAAITYNGEMDVSRRHDIAGNSRARRTLFTQSTSETDGSLTIKARRGETMLHSAGESLSLPRRSLVHIFLASRRDARAHSCRHRQIQPQMSIKASWKPALRASVPWQVTKYMLRARHGHIESRRERRGCVMYVEDPLRNGGLRKGKQGAHLLERFPPFGGTMEYEKLQALAKHARIRHITYHTVIRSN